MSTFGVIVGNRGFFPDVLARDGREEILRVLGEQGHNAYCLTPEESKFGSVETFADARRCADLFRSHGDEIDGVIVSLPNFGDERAIADTLRLARLNVPVLVQATPDAPAKMTIAHRRDSFCGKMSACNNLKQYGIPYSLTTLHTVSPSSAEFKKDLAWFSGVCRVVKGMRNLRVGAIGARPAAFNTVRYSEKILEANSITVETLDLSEVIGRIGRMKDTDERAVQKLKNIERYVTTSGIPQPALIKMANDQNGQAGRGYRRLDEQFAGANQCGAMLDFTRRKSRRGPVHGNEHDERFPDFKRLRSRCLRRLRDARVAARFAIAQRFTRLEQQLRKRSEQGSLFPLQQFAETFLQRSGDGFSSHHRRHRRQGKHLWHLRRAR